MNIFKRVLIKNTIKAIIGAIILKFIKIRYGKNAFIFITRGKTGDIYLYFRFLENFLKKRNIEHYIFVGDCKNLPFIRNLYPDITGKYIKTSERVGLCLQIAYCLLSNYDKNIALNLMWDVDLPYNRCAVRLTKKFNFIESYYWFLFDLEDDNCIPANPVFNKINDKIEQSLIKYGVIKDKTVIFSPYAYCVRNLNPLFWNLLGKELENRGYKVFVMLDPKTEKNENLQNISTLHGPPCRSGLHGVAAPDRLPQPYRSRPVGVRFGDLCSALRHGIRHPWCPRHVEHTAYGPQPVAGRYGRGQAAIHLTQRRTGTQRFRG